MSVDKQQQIIGYFIEEAKEHLNTLEDGLMNLQAMMEDPESINEMFRAAHSVKGGAAMLGFRSIQTTAHHLEDCLKILKEHPTEIQSDRKVEDLFLKGYDTLSKLVDMLQGPYGLRNEEADVVVANSEPIFVDLQNYLNQLVGGTQPSAVSATFANDVMNVLKQMLAIFKGADNATSRQQLQVACNRLGQMAANVEPWVKLVKTSQQVLANPQNTYGSVASLLIRELKQASDVLQSGGTIAVSPALQQLAAAPAASAPPAPPTPSPAVVAPTAAAAAPTSVQLPLEPRAAAQVLVKSFNRQQLTELTKLLVGVLKQPG